MIRAYITVLAFALGLSNFAVLAWTSGSGERPSAREFMVTAAAVILLVSLIFVLRQMLRRHDARIVARTLAQHSERIANFKSALLRENSSRTDLAKGF